MGCLSHKGVVCHRRQNRFKGIGSGVFEIRADYRTNTYRAVYSVKIGNKIYVLHCFQKKSKRGIKNTTERDRPDQKTSENRTGTGGKQ